MFTPFYAKFYSLLIILRRIVYIPLFNISIVANADILVNHSMLEK